jgi:hypothetical protein
MHCFKSLCRPDDRSASSNFLKTEAGPGLKRLTAVEAGQMFRRTRLAGVAAMLLAMLMVGITGCGTGSAVRPVLGAIAATDPLGVVAGQRSSAIVNSKTSLSVTVADDQKLGVDWTVTCSDSATPGAIAGVCGSLTHTHTDNGLETTYTAPSIVPLDNPVTITAAATVDPTRTAVLNLTIMPLPITIAFGDASGPVLPPSNLTVGASVGLVATVTNDSTASGVNWTVSCGSTACGSFASGNPIKNQTASGNQIIYTAPATIPPGGTVTVTATSVIDHTKSKSATITLVPVVVNVSPATLSVATAGIASFIGTSTDLGNLGLDWTLSCGVTGSCGTITSHTASGATAIFTAPSAAPAGPVTVTATSASPAIPIAASATITILPISIKVVPAAVTLGLTQKQIFKATLTNDGAYKGLVWALTCGTPGSCGTLSSTVDSPTTYTAPASLPAGNTATLTAASITDPTRSAMVTITLSSTPVLQVAISQAPTSPVAVSTTTKLAATVSYDSLVPAQQGVDWSIACGAAAGACGTVWPTHTATGALTTYTAPSAIPTGATVTLTATSTADNSKYDTVDFTINAPISIAFGQAPTSPVTTGATETLTAVVTNDLATGGGVDWSCTPLGACGRFATMHTVSGASTVYTAPKVVPTGAAVTITATSTAAPTTQFVVQKITVNASTAVAVSFYPTAPSALTVGSTVGSAVPVNLAAVVVNEATYAGVDWSVCSSQATCGQFLVTPAAPITPSNPFGTPAVYGSSVHTASGVPAIYVPPTTVPSPNTVVITASSHATPAAKASATMTVTTASTGVALTGFVQSGTTPIVGSRVALYAAGTSGYASASTLLSPGSGYVTTDATGSFTIPATYTCPAQTSLLYLVATGGNAGPGSNPNAVLMTALGPCNGTNSTAPIYVTEATTVASVWALAPFMSSSANVGSSSNNATTGMANAFGTVNNLVNINTGEVLGTTAVGNGTVPFAEINTLASLLATCVQTSGGQAGDGSACSALFLKTNPAQNVATAATDTLQAALDLALNPSNLEGNNTINMLFALLPATPAYQPVLTASPNDFTIALNFVGGGLESSGTSQNRPSSTAMAIDAAGNIWVTNSRIPSVTELSNLGAPLSPWTTGPTRASAGGFRDPSLTGPNSIAIDLLGNVWVGNSNGSLTELSYTGVAVPTLTPGGFIGGGLSDGRGIAIDSGDPLTSPGGNIWVAGTGSTGVAKFNGSTGAPVAGSPFTGGNIIGVTSGAIALDGAGTVWVGDSFNNTMVELNSLTGALLGTNDGSVPSAVPPIPSQLVNGVGANIAIDGTGSSGKGNVWIPGTSTGSGSGGDPLAELYSTGLGGTILNPIPLAGPGPLAIDGNGRAWLTTQGFSTAAATYLPSLIGLTNGGGLISQFGYAGPLLINSPTGVAVDGSGNVWVLTGGNYSTLTEFVGVAAPVTTPLALAAQKGKLGKKP